MRRKRGLKMLEKINGKKIELMPKIPKENEKLCDTCDGIGWLYDKEKGFIEKCRDCYVGVIHLCHICHKPVRGMCMNKDCRAIRDAESEEKALSKAIKAEYKDVPLEHKEMLYSESYGYNEGYFSDIDELIEYCEGNDIEVPKHVWSTAKTELSIDAENIIETFKTFSRIKMIGFHLYHKLSSPFQNTLYPVVL